MRPRGADPRPRRHDRPGRRAGRVRAAVPRSSATSDDALRFATDLEERLVRAHLQALAELPDAEQRRAAAEIGADEGAHLAACIVLRGEPAAQHAFVTGTQ